MQFKKLIKASENVFIVKDEEVTYVYGKGQLIEYAKEQLEYLDMDKVMDIDNKYNTTNNWNEELAIKVLEARGFSVETKEIY